MSTAPMEWERLLSIQRFRTSAREDRDRRNEFERDYDRLVACSSFRRLQDKAQVFPLERNDFVRTRLTHSLEVSTVGMSLVLDLLRRKPSKLKAAIGESYGEAELETLLGVACLAHDLGNPPFGHSGESSIQSWFRDRIRNPSGPPWVASLNEDQRADFLKWEGNAQTLRIVLRLQRLRDEFGLNLTFATLATLQKYVASSQEADKTGQAQSRRKPGFFQSEKELLLKVSSDTGLLDSNGIARRHPLAYLMEAADDITYASVDIEDALKKNIVSFETVREELNPTSGEIPHLLKRLDSTYRELKSDHVPRAHVTAWMTFRIAVISEMFHRALTFFDDHFDEISTGRLDVAIVKKSTAEPLWHALRTIATSHVYTAYPICALETTGDRVIRGLLDAFVPAILEGSNSDNQNGKIYRLLPGHARFHYERGSNCSPTVYEGLLFATDFISGMTDSYALQLYRQLHGIELGELGH